MPADLQKSDQLELDLKRYELRRGDTVLRLEKIPMELLIFLVEHKDRLVSREEIIERIWGRDVFLDTEQGINTAVRKIRLALRDDAEQPRHLQTVVGKGYRFIGQITVTSDERGSSTQVPNESGPPLPGPVTLLSPSPPRTFRLPVSLIAVSVLAILAALILKTNIFGLRHRLLNQALPIHSIAVLPLENLSGDPSQEYLADGLTDELITHLAKLGSLKVISRTSVMQYKSTNKSLPEIARALDVDGIVEGSVARSGSKVRVTVQLLRAANDQHLWAEDYVREVGDLIDLQREIARTIVHQIALNLNPEQQAYFALQSSHDPELNEAYLRGLFFWDKRTEADLHRAIDNFKLAISRDPGFPPAYAGVANSYNLLWYLGFMKADEAVPQARGATEKALGLDPSSAEAHVALSYLKLHYDWDWAGAEKESRLAVELSPGYSLAHQWYAYYLRSVGRFDEALAENERARELDPLSEIKTLGVAAGYARKYDDARYSSLIRRAMELNPSDSVPHYALADLLQKEGHTSEAALEFRTALQLDGDAPNVTLFDETLRKSDLPRAKRAVTETVIERLTTKSKTTYVSPRALVERYLRINDNENALHWLDLAFAEHSSFLVQITEDPLYDGLRTNPRFHAMLRRMRFPGAD
jgi:TolB-like protein/DNA-binding winged helix-turn-helix (wHTH) protein/Tfp pilus assembly protein PilF